MAHNTLSAKSDDNDSLFGQVTAMTSTGKQPLDGFYSMDLISVSYHGWAHSHMDSLCHMFYKGQDVQRLSSNRRHRRGRDGNWPSRTSRTASCRAAS